MASRVRAALGRLAGGSGAAASDLEKLRLAVGRTSALIVRGSPQMSPWDAEFSVYSQFGEDGILQYLLARVEVSERSFVEIGVQDYTECNTRFLLCSENWRGVIIDAGTDHLATLDRDGLRWRHTIEGVSAWVTRDNVGDLLRAAGVTGDLDLFSLDIDGNDYWVLERALEVVSPRIVVAEYNSYFGPEAAITIPYASDFERMAAHPSGVYFGASLAAFERLLEETHSLVCSNRAGNNAFFVRRDVDGDLPHPTAAEAWVRSRYRDSRGAGGGLSYEDGHTHGLRAAAHLPVIDLASGGEVPLGSVRPV